MSATATVRAAAILAAVWIGGIAAAAADQPATSLVLDLGGGVTMKLALIPAGKFMMGSPVSEKDRFKSDESLHEVTLSKPFYLGVTHVTVDQFAAFVKQSGYRTDAEKEGNGPTWRNPGIPQHGNHPVVCMSHNDAKALCDWLAGRQKKNCRLPTEAQWEYACRAGTQTAYCWGDNPEDGKGWTNWSGTLSTTSPVASFKPNAWGLYDMHGNALHWCGDCYGQYPKGPATDPADPKTPFAYDASGGQSHVLRGGAWHLTPRECRSAYRHWGAVDHRFSSLGFRVCVEAP